MIGELSTSAVNQKLVIAPAFFRNKQSVIRALTLPEFSLSFFPNSAIRNTDSRITRNNRHEVEIVYK